MKNVSVFSVKIHFITNLSVVKKANECQYCLYKHIVYYGYKTFLRFLYFLVDFLTFLFIQRFKETFYFITPKTIIRDCFM